MRVELHDHLGHPVNILTTRVLVLDDFDNPVSLTVSQQPGHVRTFHVGDKDFKEQLKMHGIDRTVIMSKLILPGGK